VDTSELLRIGLSLTDGRNDTTFLLLWHSSDYEICV
jgi:hypothetical protein